MLARNATVFTFTGITPHSLDAVIARKTFEPCRAEDASKIGFVTPIDGQPALTLQVGNVIAIVMREDDKILPPSVVRAEVERRISEIEKQQGEKPKRKQVKEDVTIELLAKAFVKTTLTRAWLDFEAGLLVIDTASKSRADCLVYTLKRCFDPDADPKIRRWKTNGSPIHYFTEWMQSGESPAQFDIDDRALITDEDGGKIRITRQNIVASDVRRLVENGRACEELAITHRGKLSFVLSHNLVMRHIEHIGIGDDDNHDEDALLVLNAHAVREVFSALNDVMGGLSCEDEKVQA